MGRVPTANWGGLNIFWGPKCPLVFSCFAPEDPEDSALTFDIPLCHSSIAGPSVGGG